jgi:hypothetical protein
MLVTLAAKSRIIILCISSSQSVNKSVPIVGFNSNLAIKSSIISSTISPLPMTTA